MGREEEIQPIGSIDDYISVTDAARELNKCTKTIRGYITSGILRARRFRGHGHSHWIHRADLQAFQAMGFARRNNISPWDMLHSLKHRLHSIETKLDFLMHVNGLDVSQLRDAPTEELLVLYDSVCDALQLDVANTRCREMVRWSGIFLQFTELEFDRLIDPTLDPQPWKPFHKLCVKLSKNLLRRPKFGNSCPMQQTYRLLDKARKHLAQAALVFEESHLSKRSRRRLLDLLELGVTKDSLDRYIASEADR